MAIKVETVSIDEHQLHRLWLQLCVRCNRELGWQYFSKTREVENCFFLFESDAHASQNPGAKIVSQNGAFSTN